MPDNRKTEADPRFDSMSTLRPENPGPAEEAETILDRTSGRAPASTPAVGVAVVLSSPAQFQKSLIDSGLVDPGDLARIAAETPEDVLKLARALTRAGKLTAYQATAASQGKTKGLVIGNYSILEKLGAGGMGVVFKARHRRLGRVVALKILPPSMASNPDVILRFRREVDAVARLSHPNVIAAVDADEDRGVHYLAMDYVDGRDLEKLVAERGPLPVGQALACLIQAARGLDAAHSAGIIHRDIKPGNLMLDGSGTVRVLDLGLARIIEAAKPFGQASGPALTQAYSYMGTVEFSAPEQAEDSRSVDGRADIYSLACTLYYLLTARPPFEAAGVFKKLMAHQERPAPSLRAARPDVPAALDAFYLKMMSKKPADRPASMAEVVRGLEACRVANEASAAHSGLRIFAEDAVKRSGSGTARGRDASVFARPGESAGLQIGDDLNFEDVVTDLREEAPPAPLVVDGGRPLRRVRSAPRRREGGRRGAGAGPLAAIGTVALLGLAVAAFLVSGRGPAREAGGVPIRPPSPDKAAPPRPAAAVAGVEAGPAPLVGLGVFSGHDHIWIDGIAASPDGRTLLSACYDSKVRHWDIATGRELRAFWHPQVTKVVAFLPDGHRAVSGCVDGLVRLWDLRTGREVRRFAGNKGPVDLALAISPDGRQVASGSGDRAVRVWEVETGELARSFEGLASPMSCLAFSADGLRLLGGDSAGSLHLLDPTTGAIRSWTAHADLVWTASFAPDGHHAISSGKDNQLIYWDLDAASEVRRLRTGHWARAALFEPGGDLLRYATQIDDQHGDLGTWDVTTGRVLESVRGKGHGNLARLPDGDLATADLDGSVRLWRPSRDLAEARALARSGEAEGALAAYGRSIRARPDDARLLIERGRLLLSRGRGADADADFARASALGSGNLQLFLDAGWWAAGPYRPSNDPANPTPEADPSRPPPVSEGRAATWKETAIGKQGEVVLLDPSDPADPTVQAYAMTAVYRPKDGRDDALLLLGSANKASFWLDGAAGPFATLANASDRSVALPIPAGRSMIVAKVGGEKADLAFRMRYTDLPYFLAVSDSAASPPRWPAVAEEYEQAVARNPTLPVPGFFRLGGVAYAELGQWKPAISAFERAIGPARDNVSLIEWRGELALIHLADGDAAAYRAVAGDALRRFVRIKDPSPATIGHALWLAAPVLGVPHLADALKTARGALEKNKGVRELRSLGALLYRSGHAVEAEGYLKQAIRAQNDVGDVHDWVFLAMVEHRLAKPGAGKSLDRARQLAGAVQGWRNKADIAHLLAEAEALLKQGPKSPSQ